MTAGKRRFGRLRVAIGLAHALALVPRWFLRAPHSSAARADIRRFMARISQRLVARIEMGGAPDGGPGTLYVANHVSWLDIPVLGGALDASFISKADVQGWPLIGRLSRRTGTIFIAREARQQAGHQVRLIGDRLAAGESLILFPEGTTSDGLSVLDFRSSLFEAARQARRIQPIAICYAGADGHPLEDAMLAKVGWFGDEPLGPNLARVAGMALSAQIRRAPCITPVPGECRKVLAARCREAVVAAHMALRQGG